MGKRFIVDREERANVWRESEEGEFWRKRAGG